jgi:predicted RNA-binding protein with PUA-like domain
VSIRNSYDTPLPLVTAGIDFQMFVDLDTAPRRPILKRSPLRLYPAPAHQYLSGGIMAYWLFKSEPFKWSWEQQVAAGKGGTFWDGVRNHSAKLNLKAMKKGDQGFFYHSNEGLEIVGIVKVIKEAYPDPTAEPGAPWVVVDVAADRKLKSPVSLAAVKADPALSKMSLVTSMRLSVQPVTPEEWAHVLKMAGG